MGELLKRVELHLAASCAKQTSVAETQEVVSICWPDSRADDDSLAVRRRLQRTESSTLEEKQGFCKATQLGHFKSSKGLSEQRVFYTAFFVVLFHSQTLRIPQSSPTDSSPSPEQMPQPDDGARDLLTCGQCGQAFPLGHILTFIQHKQGGCGTARARPQVHTPPSPANQTQRFGQGTQVEAGYVELRRMTDRRLKEEPGVRVEANRAGEF